jgi:uncharacterized membrane protein YfcA
MANDPDANDPRVLWQNQETEKVTITLDDVRRKAARMEKRVYWRNVREYAAGAVVIAFFTAALWREHGWRLAPQLLLIAATVYVMFQLHRRGTARSMPADTGLRESLDFHVRELTKQRDALHNIWLWYLLPFIPGFVAAFVVTAVDRGINSRAIIAAVGALLIFAGIWALNEWAARKIDRRIQELRRMKVDDR